MDGMELYWQAPGSERGSKPDPFGPLINVAEGDLSRVVGVGIGKAHGGRLLQLLTLEIYDTGAILRFRARDPMQADLVTFVNGEPEWIKWNCRVSDSVGTEYQSVAGGEGHSRMWRGEAAIYPAPPEVVNVITVSLVPLHAPHLVWEFDVPIR